MARQGAIPLISGARVGVVALTLLVLTGCSSVPDAMNPVEWYRSTRDAIAGRRVLLVDDVYTSGATVNECSRVLKKSGAKAVYVLTLARTVG